MVPQTQENLLWISIPTGSTISYAFQLPMERLPTWDNPTCMGTLYGRTLGDELLTLKWHTNHVHNHLQQYQVNFKEIISKYWPMWEGLVPPRIWKKSIYDLIQKTYLFKGCAGQGKGCTTFQNPIQELQWTTHLQILNRISNSGIIKNLHNKRYNVMMNGTFQSNNLICSLESNWCNIKYFGQTRNGIIHWFQGHILT